MLTSTTRTELEHANPTLEPHSKRTFMRLGAAEGCPSLAVSGTSPKPKSREGANRGAARTGREPSSQLARSGAEAHSEELVHPIVATTFPANLESSPEAGSGQGPPPDPSRERLQSLREPRCFPLIGSLAGELIPQDRLTRWGKSTPSPWRQGPALTCGSSTTTGDSRLASWEATSSKSTPRGAPNSFYFQVVQTAHMQIGRAHV